MNLELRRGEIYLVDLSANTVGSEQAGMRPVLIVQNNAGNKFSPTTIICPLTSKHKPFLATHIELTPLDCGVLQNSTVLCEQMRVVDKSRLKKKLGAITSLAKIAEVNAGIMVSVGIGA